MGAYVNAVWGCRYFWLSLVRMDLRTRYHGSVLGLGWSLLQPVVMTVILCTVFCGLFEQTLDWFAPFLMAGLTFWQFVNTVTMQGCHCFLQGEPYIRQHPAPMAIYPLRVTLGCGFHFGLGMVLVLILAGAVRGYADPLPLLSLIPTVGLILCLGWSLAVMAGLVNVMFRDTHHIAEIVLQMVFYATPVMIPPDLLAKRGVDIVLYFNPFVPFLALLRTPILDSQFPAPEMYGLAALITLTAVGLAALALRWQERKLIFHL